MINAGFLIGLIAVQFALVEDNWKIDLPRLLAVQGFYISTVGFAAYMMSA